MRLLVLLIAFLPFASFAQEKSRRTCRILVMGERGSVPSKLYLYDGKTAREIEQPRMNLSKAYDMPAGALSLKMLLAPPVEGQPVDPAAPGAAVAENVGAFYLLLTADPANKAVPVRMQVIDASVEHFKPGQMLWYNLTAVDIGGQVGKQQVMVKARSKLISDPPATAREDYNVNLSYRTSATAPLYPVCETKWIHDPAARTVLFIMPEAGTPVPRVMAFPDNPEAKKEEGKNP